MVSTDTLLPNNQTNLQPESFFEQLTFWGFCALIFFAPFFKGLFFASSQRVALIILTILFLFTSIISYQRKEISFFSNPLDYAVLALPVAYLASTFSAINFAFALDEVVENIFFFLVFWTALRVISTPKHIEMTFIVLYLGGICTALVGLFAAADWLAIKSAYITQDGGTIASVFQYKNTMASFLTVVIFISYYLMFFRKDNLNKYLLGSGSYLLLIVLFSTQSHGGYLIFGAFFMFLCLLYPANKRFALILTTLILALLGFLASKMFLINVLNKNIWQGWLWVLAGLGLACLYLWLFNKYQAKAPNIPLKPLLGALLVLLLGGLVVLYLTGIIDLLLGKLHMFGAMERFTMYQDSLKMVQERPFLGWGGGAWSEASSAFQSYPYIARQMHSYFLQVTIEAGLLGLFVVLGIWVLFLKLAYQVFQTSRANQRLQSLVATIICSVLAIMTHSIIDFNLSLAALTMVLFTLVACLVRLELNFGRSRPKQGSRTYSGYTLAVSLLAAVGIMTGSLLLISSDNLLRAAVEAVNARQGQQAISLTEKAILMNPLQDKNYGLAAQLYSAYQKPDTAIQYAQRAAQLASYNPNRYLELANVYLAAGQTENAAAAARKVIQLAPLKVAYYEQYSDTLNKIALKEFQAGRSAQAAKYLNNTLAIPQSMAEVLQTVEPAKKKLWIYVPPLEVTDTLKLNLAIADLLLGNTSKASKALQELAQNQELKQEVLLWQAVLAQKQGNQQEAQAILRTAAEEKLEIQKKYEEITAHLHL